MRSDGSGPSPRRPARAWSSVRAPIPRLGSRSSRPGTTPTSSSRSSTARSPSSPRPASDRSGSRCARCGRLRAADRGAPLRDDGAYAAVICLGCVIQGETPHFTFVCAEAARGCTLVALETGMPVAFGVITAHTHDAGRGEGGRRGRQQGQRGRRRPRSTSPACSARSRRRERGARHAVRRHAGADRRCCRRTSCTGGGRGRRARGDSRLVDGPRRSPARDRRSPAA